MKPVIALTSRRMKDHEYTYDYANIDYIDALAQANAIPFLVLSVHNMDEVVKHCDGLLLSGGADVNPTLYQETAHSTVNEVYDVIDEQDLALIDCFVKAKKPILGICRGMQILNVYFKGSLIQDIPATFPLMQEIHSQTTPRATPAHSVNFVEGSLAYEIFGAQCVVNSFHHQALKDVPACFTVSGISEEGIVEAIESENIIALQWHPEGMKDDEKMKNLFEIFVNRCLKNNVVHS